MSRIIAAVAVAFTLAGGIAAAHADPFTPHGVWDMTNQK